MLIAQDFRDPNYIAAPWIMFGKPRALRTWASLTEARQAPCINEREIRNNVKALTEAGAKVFVTKCRGVS